MPRVSVIIAAMQRNPRDIRFKDLQKVCEAYFGLPRVRGGSHQVYKMPWSGDPRVNIQNDGGKAKPYQVRQVLKAIDCLEGRKK